MSVVVRENGQSLTDSMTDVPRVEDKVTITNGTPGVATLEIQVNGKKFKASGLEDGEEVTIDISSAMVPGDGNAVSFKVTGQPGGTANVMIWDGISE